MEGGQPAPDLGAHRPQEAWFQKLPSGPAGTLSSCAGRVTGYRPGGNTSHLPSEQALQEADGFGSCPSSHSPPDEPSCPVAPCPLRRLPPGRSDTPTSTLRARLGHTFPPSMLGPPADRATMTCKT